MGTAYSIFECSAAREDVKKKLADVNDSSLGLSVMHGIEAVLRTIESKEDSMVRRVFMDIIMMHCPQFYGDREPAPEDSSINYLVEAVHPDINDEETADKLVEMISRMRDETYSDLKGAIIYPTEKGYGCKWLKKNPDAPPFMHKVKE